MIVGAGLVGASLAIALDRIGMEVALVEIAALGELPAVFDERNLSFADATVNALSTLQVLQKLRAPGAPIRHLHVSRQGDFGRVKLDAATYGRDAFGQVVVASDFGQALEARLGELAHLTRYRPARFLGTDRSDADWRYLRIADDGAERTLATRLLVGADGTRSAVRDALDIATSQYDYRQTLFVTRARAQRAPDGTAYERFGEHGPTALLPRGDQYFGVVHSVPNATAGLVSELDDAAFLERIQRAFGWRAGRLLSVGPRSRYPALCLQAMTTTAARAVLIGNAAQTLHPIGAQGFNLGLRDALTLAELLAGQDDPGAEGLLDRYAQRRSEDRNRTLAFSDGLARLTANPDPLLGPLRSVGLLALDQISAVQALLVGGAMGYRGDVPRLCRDEGA